MEGETANGNGTLRPWPTCDMSGCTGVQATGYTLCLRHLDPAQVDEVLASLRQGERLDSRGTIIDARLLRRILDAFPKGEDARPRVKVLFIGATFSEDAWFDFVTFDIETEFSEATFCKSASFDGACFRANACFNDCKFWRQFRSLGVRFEGDANFSGALFSGPALFDRAVFNARAIFTHAKFNKDTRFLGARFGGTTDYSDCTMGDFSHFDLVQFHKQVLFERARYDASSSFRSVRFLSDASYQDARFLADVKFDASYFLGTTSFKSTQLADASFERAIFAGETLFLGTAFNGPVTLRDAKLEGPVRIAQISGELNLQGADVSGRARRYLPPREGLAYWDTLLEILRPILDGIAAARVVAANYARVRRFAKEGQGRESELVRASSIDEWKRIKQVDVEGAVPSVDPPSDLLGGAEGLEVSLDPSSDNATRLAILWTRALQLAFERSGLDALIPGFLFPIYGFGSPGINDEENVLAVIAQATTKGPVGQVTSIRVGDFSFPVFVRRPNKIPVSHGSICESPQNGAAACWAELNEPRPPGSLVHGILTAGHVVGWAEETPDLSMIVGRDVPVVTISGEVGTRQVLTVGNHFIDAAVVAVNEEQWDPGPPLRIDPTPGVGTVVRVYRGASTEYTTLTGVTETGAAPLSPYRQNWLFLEDAFMHGDSGCLTSRQEGITGQEEGPAIGLYIGDWPTGQKGEKIWGRCQNLAQIASYLKISLFECRGV
jgi:uncharacterized protein YjbI with pentapeptide repeats